MSAAGAALHYIGKQLRHPFGFGARVIGPLMRRINREPNRVAIGALELVPDDAVLELGFGPGEALKALNFAVPCGRVCGIDHSAAMLAQASLRNRGAIADGRMELWHGRFDNLPWDVATFTKILAVNVAYFFSADGAEIREAKRVLRPGGMLAVYVTDRRSMSRWKFASSNSHRIFDEQGLRELMIRGGFAEHQVAVYAVALPMGIRGLLAVARRTGEPAAPRSGVEHLIES